MARKKRKWPWKIMGVKENRKRKMNSPFGIEIVPYFIMDWPNQNFDPMHAIMKIKKNHGLLRLGKISQTGALRNWDGSMMSLHPSNL